MDFKNGGGDVSSLFRVSNESPPRVSDARASRKDIDRLRVEVSVAVRTYE